MKIEKLNNDQVRIVLGQDDLKARELSLRDLAYGSDKTKALFDDMVHTAENQFGFEPSGKPLMIEAIPMPDETLMITLTRVSGRAEAGGMYGSNVPGLGTPLSPDEAELPGLEELDSKSPEEAKALIEQLLSEMEEAVGASDNAPKRRKDGEGGTKIFAFPRFKELRELAAAFPASSPVMNSLYKEEGGDYYLIVRYRKQSKEVVRALNVINEFCPDELTETYAEALVEEHCKLVIKRRALQKLSEIENGD